MVGLKWKDVDFNGKSCTIARSIIYNEGKVFESTPKTKYGVRVISLTDEFCKQLGQLKRRQTEELRKLEIEQTEETFVCVTPFGNSYHPDYITRVFKRFLEKTGSEYGLKIIRFHDLRHSFASVAIFECGIAPEVVSKMLGHATSSFTLDTYGHASMTVKKEAAEKFDSAFNNYSEKEIALLEKSGAKQ